MPKKQFNTFSFNNFKPFGEKMQSFSKKPITLIYGPNSVGKSSLLQSALYLEYLNNLIYQEKQDSDILNLKQSHFAGDELDLGGFSNFVHKKDLEKSMIYTSTLKKEEDLEKFFPLNYKTLKKFNEEGMFEFLENIGNSDEVSIKNIQDRLKNYQIKDGHYGFSSARRTAIKNIGSLFNKTKNEFIEYFNLKDNPLADTIFNDWLNSESKYEDIIFRKDNKKLDQFDKYLLFHFDLMYPTPIFNNEKEINKLNQEVIKIMLSCVPYYKYITNISSIGMTSIIAMNKNQKLSLQNIFEIDNEVICTVTYTGSLFKSEQFIKVSSKNKFFKDTFNYITFGKLSDKLLFLEKSNLNPDIKMNKETKSNNKYDFIQARYPIDLSDPFEGLTLGLVESFSTLLESDIQYIGPLRYLPSRNEYYKMVNNKHTKKESLKSEFDFEKHFENFLKKYNEKVYSINNKFLKNILSMEKKYVHILIVLFYFPIGLAMQSKYYFNTSALSLHVKNIFRSKFNKLSSGNAKTSEKMWKNLLSSVELQEQVNFWLSNEKKLKTSYRMMPINGITEFVDIQKNTVVSIKDMGLGISQVLPILISSITTKNNKIFMEQPELHLHPAVQCEIADEFIRSYKKNNNEFMIETHSEHILLRILKRMRHTAEGKLDKDDVLALTSDDVCLLYVDNDGDNTFINELELDEDGSLLDPWPNGFFEEGHRERFD